MILSEVNKERLYINSRRVLRMIQENKPGWEKMVPRYIEEQIKSKNLFGYNPEKKNQSNKWQVLLWQKYYDPNNLDEYIGQEHLVGSGAILRNAIESGNIPSMILWGPPGVGKTTLAFIISKTLKRPFFTLSAISSGVKDVRQVIAEATNNAEGAILFIDEIHRFNKSQQDSLLGAVERGIITLIGATTENPSFEVISPLLSRCQVYILKELEKEDLLELIERGRFTLENQD